jgi:nitroreductase
MNVTQAVLARRSTRDFLPEPYRTYRYQVGEALYGRLGIGREDRRAWFAHNYEGFGAPLMVFFSIDRNMGALQWGDLGLYLQTAMLLFQERGFATCPQAAWATIGRSLEGWLHLPTHRMLALGLAVGRARSDSPVNQLETERAPLDHFARFHAR